MKVAPACGNRLIISAMCNTRLRVANGSEIRRFWDAVTPVEVSDWVAVPAVPVMSRTKADGTTHGHPTSRWFEDPGTAARIRIINLFDPAIRDRRGCCALRVRVQERNVRSAGTAALGLLCYLLLEADRFVGRIELKGDRGEGRRG